jgi:DNA repair and recombination protein RAD52
MAFKQEQIDALKAPLSREHVTQRSQSGRTLSYIEGWHAISEANRIFGFDAWDSHTETEKLFEPYQDDKKQWRVGYMGKCTISVAGVLRTGVGYGSGISRDLGDAHESALKEAETDARKRALMTFGNPFGLALYDKTQSNVADATPEPPKPKNDAGVMKVKAWAAEHLADLHSSEDGEDFIQKLEASKGHWIRVCGKYPGVWVGPERTGLVNDGAAAAQIYEVRDSYDTFIQMVEAKAADAKESK